MKKINKKRGVCVGGGGGGGATCPGGHEGEEINACTYSVFGQIGLGHHYCVPAGNFVHLSLSRPHKF